MPLVGGDAASSAVAGGHQLVCAPAGLGRLLPTAGRLVWRLKWTLLILFVLDWWLVSLDLAILITLRIVLLTGAFAILFATTMPEELRLALEWLRLPYRYAFSFSLALQSVGLFEAEWRTIREAQQARRRVGAVDRMARPAAPGARSRGAGCACGGDDHPSRLGHDRGCVRSRLRLAAPAALPAPGLPCAGLAVVGRGAGRRRSLDLVAVRFVITWSKRCRN